MAGRQAVMAARDVGKTIPNPYSHSRAFTTNPGAETLNELGDLLEHTWGTRTLRLLDPFSGGGSIPFEGLRYGFETFANELNPVASVILRATLDYPFRFGPAIAKDVERFGSVLSDVVAKRLAPFFTDLSDEYPGALGASYLWARTVRCPYTGKPIPLSPNWWLYKNKDKPPSTRVAARPSYRASEPTAKFEVLRGSAISGFDPSEGTIKGGNAVSPWAHNQPVEGDYIKAEAQAGRLGQQLYALAIKRRGGFEFRAPRDVDMEAVEAAENELRRNLPTWQATGIVPSEEITSVSNYDRGHRLYGISHWHQAFAPRQLLTLGTIVEELRGLEGVVRRELGDNERAEAVLTLLGIAVDKACDYNSRFSRWHSGRSVAVNTFDKHGYGFLWSHPEFDGSGNLVQWIVSQVADATASIASLAQPDGDASRQRAPLSPITLRRGSASEMDHLESGSVHHICTDPPYEANVMYAECADFFYVWMKRTIGRLHPDFFKDELTNKDDEAVANLARFSSMGRRRKELALEDYERKMASAFREMHRVLTDEGVLTVMFTHKKVEAWDTLATSLIGAGFAIHSSWPVHTESENSLHQAKKNAAQSTIMLTCRKRSTSVEPVWWDDLKGRIRRVAREKAGEFEAQGIRGVDLYIATFGPTLAILSENWPVLTSEVDERTGEPKPLRPEIALDLAREEVVELRKQGLLLGRKVAFDPFTDWYLMAWDAFRAQEFPGDEARKLALALGLDLERQVIGEKKLVTKKAATVSPRTTPTRGHARPAPKSRARTATATPCRSTSMPMAPAWQRPCGLSHPWGSTPILIPPLPPGGPSTSRSRSRPS